MKILLVSRATLFSNPGGDTIQITQTAQHLKNIGVDVDIKLTSEKIEYGDYDIIHFFNIIRPADILRHTWKTEKPYVVSTIFVDYAEFERKNTTGVRKIFSRLFSSDTMEYIKAVARSIWNKERIGSKYYLFCGHRKSVKKVIANAAMLLPNSESEYKRLRKKYGIDAPYVVVPNGIEPSKFGGQVSSRRKELSPVVCVARIEPLKNQLNLIKALRSTEFRLLIIGKASANHHNYFRECKAAANANVQFIDYIPQSELLKFYNEAKVHVLASWFETTGLSSLEAAACGCNIVITDKGDTREYFNDYAYYCDPQSPSSILHAVQRAMDDPVNEELAAMVKRQYTWDIAGQRTFEAYKKILSKIGR